MAPKHSNPSRPRVDRDRNQYTAHAPYNFIPLADTVVPALTDIPGHDTYRTDTLTGWIDCEIETRAPTYIRGMMVEAVFAQQGLKKPDELTPADKEERAPFFSSNDKTVEGRLEPALPGSSLRGMIRQLVETLGYGRIRWVADQPKMFYRAVAASKDDPLRDSYDRIIGRFAKHVHAGYLLYDDQNDDWYIMPARRWPTGEEYVKIKDEVVKGFNLAEYLDFNHKDYRPQIHAVSFEPETKQGKRGSFIQINGLGVRGTYRFKGNLVCAGNMLEGGDVGRTQSPRARQALVLLPDQKKSPLKIPKDVIRDYLDSLTPFQRDQLSDWSDGKGCLGQLKPIFYVLDQDKKEVLAFGHSPNFRIPALIRDEASGRQRAATPYDFVPEDHKGRQQPDLADAIFGWVEENDGPGESRAGRVFFGDARFTGAKNGVWMEMMTPQVLASPKASTFQHYLVQDKRQRHDPDQKQQLAHYASARSTTQIRGTKNYWHRGSNPAIKAATPREGEKDHETQHTRIVPLRPGVSFACRIRFENLRPEELGLLWWALALPVGDNRRYCHKIGMGKPLGMGGIAIRPKLTLTDRPKRYDTLFTGDSWQESATTANPESFIKSFEQYILDKLSPDEHGARFSKLERIRMLLEMLAWREDDPAWSEVTRYMEIEHGLRKLNEYKERPVLPDPLHVK